MSRITNNTIVEMVKEITVAALSSTTRTANEANGKDVAAFMQAIYDKLNEFASKDQ